MVLNRLNFAILSAAVAISVSACSTYINERLASAPTLSLASIISSSTRDNIDRHPITYPCLAGSVEIAANDVIDFGELMWRLQDPGGLPDKPEGTKALVRAIHALWQETLGEEQANQLVDEIGEYIKEGFRPKTDNLTEEEKKQKGEERDKREKDVLDALNILIAPPDNKLPLHERLRNKIAEITQTDPPTTTTGLGLFEDNKDSISQSPEFRYLECAYRNNEVNKKKAAPNEKVQEKVAPKELVHRLNRVLVEDLFRRAFAPSISLHFLVPYLDDEVQATCDCRVPTSIDEKISAAPSLCMNGAIERRHPLVPGDVVNLSITSILPTLRTGTYNKPTSLDSFNFGLLRFPVRYLPDTANKLDKLPDNIEEYEKLLKRTNSQLYEEEKRFILAGVRAHTGTHSNGGTRGKQQLNILEQQARKWFAKHLDEYFPDYWNAILDPAVGALSVELHSAKDNFVNGLAGHFVRTMLKAGPHRNGTCHSDPDQGWWVSCPDNVRVGFDNLFEDRFSNYLTICSNSSVNGNFLAAKPDGGKLDEVPSLLKNSFFQNHTSANLDGSESAMVSQVRIDHDRIGWVSARTQDRPWSLLEWEASRILGAFSPKVSRIYFDGSTISVKDKDGKITYPFPRNRFGVDIAWPEDTRAPTVHLMHSSGGLIRLERLPGYETAPPIISYRDLRLLGRPTWFPETEGDDVEQYIGDVPLGFRLTQIDRLIDNEGILESIDRQIRSDPCKNDHILSRQPIDRIIDMVADTEGVVDVSKSPMWDDRCGFRPEGVLHNHFFSRPKILRAVGLQDLANYALSVDAWARYRLMSPDVGTRITGLRFGKIGFVRVVDDITKANLQVAFDLAKPLSGSTQDTTRYIESHGLVLQSGRYNCVEGKACTFEPRPIKSSDLKTLYWRDLDKLTAFQVSEVRGLSNAPLVGYLEE